MTVLVDDNHFSPKSSASRKLATALREVNHDPSARLTIKYFQMYTEGLSEIIKIENPARNEILQLWYKLYSEKIERLRPTYEENVLPFYELENLLIHRLRQARQHGAMLSKMRRYG